MNVKAGDLRHRVVIERPVETGRSPSGDVRKTFVPFATVYARVEPTSGQEIVKSRAQEFQVKYEHDTKITIRWSPVVDETRGGYRITFRGVRYHVQAATQRDMARDTIVFLCKTGIKED